MLGLQSHKIDFEILPTRNSKKIVFLDASEYFEEPESPILQIFLPGHSKYFLVNIEARKINVLSSNTIGYSDILNNDAQLEFPDGIYKFVYKICPYNALYLTKYYLRTNKIENDIYQIYSTLDFSCETKDHCSIKKELLDIHVLLESAKANTELELIDKGNKDLSLAQQKVLKLLNKCEK